MLLHLVQVLADLREPSVLRDLQLYRDLHVRLRGHAHLDPPLLLHHSRGSQDHLPPHLPLHLLARGIARAEHPPLSPPSEGEAHVLEVPRGHDEHLLVGEVDELRLATRGLDLLAELIDVRIELLLQLEVIGD